MNDLKESTRQETMIQQQVVERGIRDPRVLAALRSVQRERFFPPGSKDEAYADRPAPIGHGQTISQPDIVALMTQRLCVGPSDRVLEIGTGSGYQTAILANLAGEVYTVERLKPLLDAAWERLMEMNIPQRALSPRRRHAGLARRAAVRSRFNHCRRAARAGRIAAGPVARWRNRRPSGGPARRNKCWWKFAEMGIGSFPKTFARAGS